jgi:hypothetical protein
MIRDRDGTKWSMRFKCSADPDCELCHGKGTHPARFYTACGMPMGTGTHTPCFRCTRRRRVRWTWHAKRNATMGMHTSETFATRALAEADARAVIGNFKYAEFRIQLKAHIASERAHA